MDAAPAQTAPSAWHADLARAGQVELSVRAGGIVNDPLFRTPLLGVAAQWHATEGLGLEVHAATALQEGDGDCDDPRMTELGCAQYLRAFEPGEASVSLHGYAQAVSASLTIRPLAGLLEVGRGRLGVDLYGSVGGGAVRLAVHPFSPEPTWLPEARWAPSTDVAVGAHLALAPRVALRTEVRTSFYIVADKGTLLRLTNPWIADAGLSVVLGR